MPPDGQSSYTISEPRSIPWEGLLLGYAAMVPTVAGSIAVWLLQPPLGALVAALTTIWAASIVAFLAGVRRGLSFRAPQGATAPQIVTMLWLFSLAVLALALGPSRAATLILLIGYLSLAVFDTWAARREEAPPYFARLRPLQMSIPIACMVVLLIWQTAGFQS